jgi:hypothetical protein
MIGLLSHPLTLLLVGALLTTILGPRLSQGWQDRAKQLELKALLIEDIAQSTETFFSQLQLLELKGDGAPVSLDDALANWRTSYAVLDAKLSTYFPHVSTVEDQWIWFGSALWATYFLFKNDTPAARRETMVEFANFLPDPQAYPNLISESIAHVKDRQTYDVQLQMLLDRFRFRRRDLMASLLNEKLVLRTPRKAESGSAIKRLVEPLHRLRQRFGRAGP